MWWKYVQVHVERRRNEVEEVELYKKPQERPVVFCIQQ